MRKHYGTRTRRVHTSANLENFLVNGPIQIVNDFLYPDYEVNEAENRKGSNIPLLLIFFRIMGQVVLA